MASALHKSIFMAALLGLLALSNGVEAQAAASASGTTVPGSVAQIVDAQGNKWTLANGSVAINGMSLCSSPPAILLVYLGNTVYEENSSAAWFWWNGSAWVQNSCGDPRISGGSSSSSSSGSSSGGSSSSSSGTTSSSSSGTTSSSTGSSSGTASGSSSGSGSCSAGTIPAFDHVVLVMEENHGYSEIIGSSEAPYINSLASHGALFTDSFAIGHPSEPNYFGLFSGSDWGIADDNDYNFPGPTLAGELNGKGKTFVGYIDSGSPRHHNPWESFADSQNVEQPFSSFPSDFTKLPLVSWVIPNLNNDMHDGTIQQGDGWLQSNLSAYATWAQTHNSLLIVTWDEDDSGGNNQIATIFFGANVITGQYNELINHYNVLRTLEDMFGLASLANSASAAPITDAWHCSSSSGSSSSSSSSGSASSSSSGSSSGTISSTSGVCGSDNNQTLASTPTHLCTAGTPTAVTTDGAAWIWNCTGTGTGDTPGCFAYKSNTSSSSSSSSGSSSSSSSGGNPPPSTDCSDSTAFTIATNGKDSNPGTLAAARQAANIGQRHHQRHGFAR
jgi:hypothetical protein